MQEKQEGRQPGRAFMGIVELEAGARAGSCAVENCQTTGIPLDNPVM